MPIARTVPSDATPWWDESARVPKLTVVAHMGNRHLKDYMVATEGAVEEFFPHEMTHIACEAECYALFFGT